MKAQVSFARFNIYGSRFTLHASLPVALVMFIFLVFFGSVALGSQSLNIAAAGDLLLDRGVRLVIEDRGTDYLLQEMAPFLRSYDFTVANLECPLSDRGTPGSKPFVFRGDPDTASSLRQGGISVLTLANNHILDYGAVALGDTIEVLKSAGILPLGAGHTLEEARAPLYFEQAGITVAWLAAYLPPAGVEEKARYPGPYLPDPISLGMQVAALKSEVDWVIVSLHWGIEYATQPSPEQRQTAYHVIDQGADLILGHHPHVIQGIEGYREGIIVYSLGNFVFDSLSRDGRDTVLFTARLRKKGALDIKLFPVVIDQGRPSFARGTDYRRIAETLASRSAALGLFVLDQGNFLSIP